MGIDKDVAKFLLSAKERKVNFQKSLMLGNQKIELSAAEFKGLAQEFGVSDFAEVKSGSDFFYLLGAQEISAMDISDYENAAILHDLNQPIDEDLQEKFTFVLDGGTLEHIFNFPTALANAMKMVEVGGHLMIITGGNNFLGHGFYQFSPELFYRTFSDENGFTVNRMIAAEVGGNWYEVADPKIIKGRVELINNMPTYLMVLAEKTVGVTPFLNTPQQSDYVEKWHGENNVRESGKSFGGLKNLIKSSDFLYRHLVRIKQSQIAEVVRKEKSFANQNVYKLVDK